MHLMDYCIETLGPFHTTQLSVCLLVLHSYAPNLRYIYHTDRFREQAHEHGNEDLSVSRFSLPVMHSADELQS